MSIITLCISLTFITTVTTIAGYAMSEFNVSESKAGLAASIIVFGMLTSRLVIGKYLEVIGRRKLSYIGVFLTFIGPLFYFLADNLNLLILVRLFHGIGIGIALSVFQTAVIDIIPVERRGEGVSFYSLSFILGTGLGSFLGVFIIQFGHMYLIFALCSILTSLSIILTFLVSIPKAIITSEQLKEMKRFHLKDFFEKQALPLSIMVGLLTFSYSSILSFLASYAMEIQLMYAASFFFVVYSVFVFISRPITGRILDTKGDNIVMYPCFIFLALGLLFLSQASHGLTLLLAGALIGLGFGNLQSASQTIAINKTPRHRFALTTSTFYICTEIGVGLGPFLLGFLIPIIGYRHLYLALSGLVVACACIYYVIHGRRKSMNKEISLGL